MNTIWDKVGEITIDHSVAGDAVLVALMKHGFELVKCDTCSYETTYTIIRKPKIDKSNEEQ